MKKLLLALTLGLLCRVAYADTKISAMTSTTTLNAGDIIPVVTNPGSSPANFSITKTNLISTLGAGVAGSNTQVQFNNNGTFGANSKFTWDGSIQGLVLDSTQTLVAFGTIKDNLELHRTVNEYNCQQWTDDNGNDDGFGICRNGSVFDIRYFTDVHGSGGPTASSAFWSMATNGSFPTGSTVTLSVPLVLYTGNTANRFLKTGSSREVTTYDLFNDTPTWAGQANWTSASPSTFTALTISGLTSGQCVQTTTGGRLTVSGSACGTGSGGSSALAVTTGTSSGFSWIASSPTAVVNFSSASFSAALTGSATAFITLNSTQSLTRIVWGDGTVQVSSPPASGGSSSARQKLHMTFDGSGGQLSIGSTYYVIAGSSGTLDQVYTTCMTTSPTVSTFGSLAVNVSSSAAFGVSNIGSVMCASDCPSLSNSISKVDKTLSGWTTAVAKDTVYWFTLQSVTGCVYATIDIEYLSS